jgi:hypothetical protein
VSGGASNLGFEGSLYRKWAVHLWDGRRRNIIEKVGENSEMDVLRLVHRDAIKAYFLNQIASRIHS